MAQSLDRFDLSFNVARSPRQICEFATDSHQAIRISWPHPHDDSVGNRRLYRANRRGLEHCVRSEINLVIAARRKLIPFVQQKPLGIASSWFYGHLSRGTKIPIRVGWR